MLIDQKLYSQSGCMIDSKHKGKNFFSLLPRMRIGYSFVCFPGQEVVFDLHSRI